MSNSFSYQGENTKNEKMDIHNALKVILCVVIVLSFVRCFFGVELTDEMYSMDMTYFSIMGNYPYTFNNFSWGSGEGFLIIPIMAIYKWLVPSCKGIILYMRICYSLFRLFTVFIVYRIITRRWGKTIALTIGIFLIAYEPTTVRWCFSYNTLPFHLVYSISFVLFDLLTSNFYKHRLSMALLCGGAMSFAVLAHPAYGIAVIIQLVLWIISIRKNGNTIKELLFFIFGEISVPCLVGSILSILTSPQQLFLGLRGYFVNEFPTLLLVSESNLSKIITVFMFLFKRLLCWIGLFVLVYFVVYFIQKKKNNVDIVKISFAVSTVVLIFIENFKMLYDNEITRYRFGVLGSLLIVAILVFGRHDANMLFLIFECGCYMVMIPFFMCLVVDSDECLPRFGGAGTAFATGILVLLILYDGKIRTMLVWTAILSSLCLVINAICFFTPYADNDKYDTMIPNGIWAGIVDTNEKAKFMPMIEDYINSMIDDSDFFAFRDSFSAGYMMVHHGQICEKGPYSYAYQRRCPEEIYEYYNRRKTIPTKIIYIRKRDDVNSLDDDTYQYNEFLKKYYVNCNTFYLNFEIEKIDVYDYIGGFDGDYSYWINSGIKAFHDNYL